MSLAFSQPLLRKKFYEIKKNCQHIANMKQYSNDSMCFVSSDFMIKVVCITVTYNR